MKCIEEQEGFQDIIFNNKTKKTLRHDEKPTDQVYIMHVALDACKTYHVVKHGVPNIHNTLHLRLNQCNTHRKHDHDYIKVLYMGITETEFEIL